MNRQPFFATIKPTKINIIIAARFEIQRQGLERILHDDRIVSVVATCKKKSEIIEAVKTHKPDVLLIEHAPHPISVLQSIEASVREHPNLGVLVLSDNTDPDAVQGAIEAGAKGFYSKNVSIEMLRGAMLMIARGSVQFSPEIKFTLINPEVHLARQPDPTEIYEKLTDRESEILDLMSRGYNNLQIAKQLYLAEGTVKNHVSAILRSLSIQDRTQAVILALRGELG